MTGDDYVLECTVLSPKGEVKDCSDRWRGVDAKADGKNRTYGGQELRKAAPVYCHSQAMKEKFS